MTNQEAYINGFVKRAAEYGYSAQEAIELLKTSGVPPAHIDDLGAALSTKAQVKPVVKSVVKPTVKPTVKPQPVNKSSVNPAMENERMMQPNQRAYNQIK